MDIEDKGEFRTGVSQHAWNNWYKLASTLQNYCTGKITEAQVKLDLKNLMEGVGTTTGSPREVVKTYDSRADLERLTEPEAIAINNGRISEGKDPLDFNKMRKLRESAQQCNLAIRGAVYEGKPMPWGQLYDAVAEASHIIYGKEARVLEGIARP